MSILAKVRQKQIAQVAIGVQGPSGAAGSIRTLSDVDVTNIEDGSVLVYKESTEKWVATRDLEKQRLEGGQY